MKLSRGKAAMAAPIDPEKLAYWFFRLNGCLTIENFVVHDDTGSGGQRTDADILGVRFPYRSELLINPMKDYSVFYEFAGDRPSIFIAEVKSGSCQLNGPWTKPDRENMQRALKAIGALPETEVEEAADALYTTRKYDSASYAVRLFGVGESVGDFTERHPNAIALTWEQIITFIFDRFRQYHRQKSDHGQWDVTGKRLFRCAIDCAGLEQYISEVGRSGGISGHVANRTQPNIEGL